jgi:hypothetical protein
MIVVIARTIQAMPEPIQTRADIASISILTDMYEAGQAYIAEEATEGDNADVAKMVQILGDIETLIESEASEPNDPSVPIEDVEGD